MTEAPMQLLAQAVRRHGLVRFFDYFAQRFPDFHLKETIVHEIGPHRQMVVQGKKVINFGCDSFLGLDQDPRVQNAIKRGVDRWGTHNGSSRAFSSVDANEEAEEKLAKWLGAEATVIFPSVTLANMGALPGLVGRRDLLVVDEHAHNSIQEAARMAESNGVRIESFSHCDSVHLQGLLREVADYRIAVAAFDGVYSMSGELPPLLKLDEVARKHRTVLYVDDAHGTGVLGKNGRGTVFGALGSYDNTLVVGSLSKAFSCAGAFIACSNELKRLIKMRSSTYIFGGPIPPPYLVAICTVCDILSSGEYEELIGRLRSNLRRLVDGAKQLELTVCGGAAPIVSIFVGEEENTLKAGHFLFERGYYVQSVTFPAVPYNSGVLRIQVNANHLPESVDGLLGALAELPRKFHLSGPKRYDSAVT